MHRCCDHLDSPWICRKLDEHDSSVGAVIVVVRHRQSMCKARRRSCSSNFISIAKSVRGQAARCTIVWLSLIHSLIVRSMIYGRWARDRQRKIWFPLVGSSFKPCPDAVHSYRCLYLLEIDFIDFLIIINIKTCSFSIFVHMVAAAAAGE